MSLAIDIILIAILGLCIWRGYKRGFIRSIMGIISFIIALLCAWNFYAPLSDFYNEKFIKNNISNQIYESINNIIVPGINSLELSELINNQPEVFRDIISRFKGDMNAVKIIYDTQTGKDDSDIIKNISDFMASSTSEKLSDVLAFLTIYIIVFIIIRIIILIVDLIFKLPVLNLFNHVAGIVLGAVKGCAYIWLLCTLLIISIPLLSVIFPEIFNDKIIQSSFFVNFASKNKVTDFIFIK